MSCNQAGPLQGPETCGEKARASIEHDNGFVVLESMIHFPIVKTFFFFLDKETHQGWALQTVNRVIQRELLVGIKPRMSESTGHPKPPTTRLHPDKLKP
jgi:hypothetical protein